MLCYMLCVHVCVQLLALRGTVLEEAIPSAAKVGTNKSLPPRDVLEYACPGDIQLTCLKLGKSDKKVCPTFT